MCINITRAKLIGCCCRYLYIELVVTVCRAWERDWETHNLISCCNRLLMKKRALGHCLRVRLYLPSHNGKFGVSGLPWFFPFRVFHVNILCRTHFYVSASSEFLFIFHWRSVVAESHFYHKTERESFQNWNNCFHRAQLYFLLLIHLAWIFITNYMCCLLYTPYRSSPSATHLHHICHN